MIRSADINNPAEQTIRARRDEAAAGGPAMLATEARAAFEQQSPCRPGWHPGRARRGLRVLATGRVAALAALRSADPQEPLPWVEAAAPLKLTTVATTRLAEHWAHGLDMTGPLGVAFPDAARLSHVA